MTADQYSAPPSPHANDALWRRWLAAADTGDVSFTDAEWNRLVFLATSNGNARELWLINDARAVANETAPTASDSDEADYDICDACNGSGEGRWDGAVCVRCNGHGELFYGDPYAGYDVDDNFREAVAP